MIANKPSQQRSIPKMHHSSNTSVTHDQLSGADDVKPQTLKTVFLALSLVSVIVGCFFNLIPSSIRLPISGVVFVGFLYIYVVGLLFGLRRKSPPFAGLYFAAPIIFANSALLNISMSGQISMVLELIRYIVGPLAFSIFFLINDFQLKRRQWFSIWLVSCAATTWVFFASFTGDPLIVGNKQRLAPFSGGADGLHPSAYITLALLWMQIQLLRRGVGYRFVTLGMIALLLAVLLGYEVRTTYVVAIAMISFSVARFLRLSPGNMLLLAFLGIMIGLPVIVLLASGVSDLDLSKFSSGRVVAWGERIDIILDRNIFQFLFGSGPGTDYFKGNETWRYEAKDSHNDFLITTIEFGVLGLLAFLSFWVALIARGRGHVLSLLATSFLLSSAISNGIINRPSVAPLFAFCTFLALCPRPATAQKRID